MIQNILKGLGMMYRPQVIRFFVNAYEHHDYSIARYTNWFLHLTPRTTAFPNDRRTYRTLWIEVLSWISLASALLLAGLFGWSAYNSTQSELLWFGLATVAAIPLLILVLIPIFDALYRVLYMVRHPKEFGRAIVCWKLESQVRRLRKAYKFTVVAVAGSMGKTSTKYAIAQVLEAAGLRVRFQAGNYNDRVTVPLVVFGQDLPNLLDIRAWRRVFRQNERVIRKGFDFDVVVVELGTDGPGQMVQFGYIKPDLLVMTAIAPEHMEYFGALDAVAREEMSIVAYAKRVLLNGDDIPAHYLPETDYAAYSVTDRTSQYYAEAERIEPTGQELNFYKTDDAWMTQYVSFLGSQGQKIVLAAAAAADLLGVERQKIAAGLSAVKPMAGRMQLLAGKKDSVIIDDTYNATPAAVEAALAVLQSLPNTQRIAILGSMNELGDFSPEAHRTVGASLNADKISLVVTIGAMARDYLAPVAEAQGCRVISVLNPHEAGEIVHAELKNNAAVLVKGSQNGVFSEEAIKPLLARSDDVTKLVRQSDSWMRKKRAQFQLP